MTMWSGCLSTTPRAVLVPLTDAIAPVSVEVVLAPTGGSGGDGDLTSRLSFGRPLPCLLGAPQGARWVSSVLAGSARFAYSPAPRTRDRESPR